MPAAPDLRWRKHSSTTAHVSEGSLPCAVGTPSRHTGDTRNGTASTPRLSGGLVASFLGNGVRLAGVVGDLSVDKCDNVRADRGLHDIGKRQGIGCGTSVSGHVIFQGLHGDEGAGGGSCHFVSLALVALELGFWDESLV
ncbi:UNVERIFIED_CONTAM: hypothetical protein Sradi_4291700 [Sesamum radiatum]|uniref:Uncharacterized protein n=1 Tax=Sesamum radiatum TaxID=300843 RepID=A0AAW2NPR1_SESRA